jgi:anti-anti-sigma regulatory factor
MLKITKMQKEDVVWKLSGRMDTENIAELDHLLRAETGRGRIVLDLEDLTLVDLDAVAFLRQCEAESVQLRNCPAYIREWINSER